MERIETLPMKPFTRRGFLSAVVSTAIASPVLAFKDNSASTIGFGFGTYGMQSLSIANAISTCAEIGYDGLEIAVIPGWSTEPTLLSQKDRAEIRKRLTDAQLAVPSILESVHCLRTEATHRENLERLKRAAQLARDVAPENPPVVQSIAGGKPAQWDQRKDELVAQLADWAKIGESNGIVICFKPHAGHMADNPERTLWLHQQVGSDWLKVVYDYAHFYLEGLPLKSSLKALLPITAYVQVKDSRHTAEKHEYLLPGDGKTDYVELLTLLKQSGYRGFVNVEVSSMIHRKPGYQPIPTANLCYRRLAPLFDQVGIKRPTRA